MDKLKLDTRNFYGQAYIRDHGTFYTGEAMLLAVLMHSVGEDRNSKDMKIVRELMEDGNLEAD